MKHLRECEYTDAYLSLCKNSRVELEDPLLSQLNMDLVIQGDFESAEAIMQQAANGGCISLMLHSVSLHNYFIRWPPGQICESPAN